MIAGAAVVSLVVSLRPIISRRALLEWTLDGIAAPAVAVVSSLHRARRNPDGGGIRIRVN